MVHLFLFPLPHLPLLYFASSLFCLFSLASLHPLFLLFFLFLFSFSSPHSEILLLPHRSAFSMFLHFKCSLLPSFFLPLSLAPFLPLLHPRPPPRSEWLLRVMDACCGGLQHRARNASDLHDSGGGGRSRAVPGFTLACLALNPS